MADTIFVSGATGNIGSEVVKQLLQRGVSVRAGARSEETARDLTEAGAKVVAVDMRELDSVRAALTGVEKAVSLSPLVPDLADLGVKFVDAAKLARVKHVVRASSLGAGSPPPITLNDWHREAERAVEASGIPYTLVRPTYFMQNYVGSGAHTIRTRNAFYLPHGDGAISSIDVRDVAAVVATVLTERGHERKTYELTGPEALTNHDVARILSRLTGRRINYVDVDDDAARQSMTDMGIPESVVDGLVELGALIRAGGRSAVTTVVEQITGEQPISFERFVEDHLEFFTAEPQAA